MHWPLFLTWLRLSRTAFLSWSFGVVVLLGMIVSIYPSIKEVAGLQEYLQAMPEVIINLGGAGDIPMEESFPGGFYDFRAFVSMEYLSWFPVMIGVYAVFYCGGLMAREVERGTADLLLSYPISRRQIVLTKFSVFAAMTTSISCISWAVLAISMPLIGAQGSLLYLGLAHLTGLLVILAIASYSTLFSCLLLEPSKALAASGGVTLGLYFINILAPMSVSLEFLQKVSPFHYFQAMPILYHGDVDLVGLGILILIIASGLLASVWVFDRRDILK